MTTQKVSVHRSKPDTPRDDDAQQRATDLVSNVLGKLKKHALEGHQLTQSLWKRQRERLRLARASDE